MKMKPFLFVGTFFLLMVLVPCFSQSIEETQRMATTTFPPSGCEDSTPYRRYDGTCNNLKNPRYGAVGASFTRGTYQGESYGWHYDDHGEPFNGLPSARKISNILFGAWGNNPPTSKYGVSLTHMLWGQFLDHDLTLTMKDNSDNFPIEVPEDDPFYQYFQPPYNFMNFSRSVFTLNEKGLRNQYNSISSYIDGSSVYGSNPFITATLRVSETTCELNTSLVNGHEMLPRNYYELPYENPTGHVLEGYLFAAGDIRANENPGLTALHTLFVREHNRLCKKIKASHPEWNGETQFQEARKWVIALLQQITFNEYIPATTGAPFDEYAGYDENVDATIDLLFATALFRYGHTEVIPVLPRTDDNGNNVGDLPLKDCYFNPKCWENDGIESLLNGMTRTEQGEIDPFYVDAIRNYLFGTPEQRGISAIDLAARNIQRGRDHGIPTYNMARAYFGLTPAASFSDISSNETIAQLLNISYNGNIDQVDAYVGALAEDHNNLFPFIGDLIGRAVSYQYHLLRAGDRFYFENTQVSGFTDDEVNQIKATRLSDIVLRNTDIKQIPCSMMYVSDVMCKPKVDPIPSVGDSISLFDGKFNFSWELIPSTSDQSDEMNFTIRAFSTGWAGFGFSETELMKGADVYAGWVNDDNSFNISDYKIGKWRNFTCPSGICSDSVLGGTDDVIAPSASYSSSDGLLTLNFRRKLNTFDIYDEPIVPGEMKLIFAMGTQRGKIGFHRDTKTSEAVVLIPKPAPPTSAPITAPVAPPVNPPVAVTPPFNGVCKMPTDYDHSQELMNGAYHLFWTIDTKDNTLSVAMAAMTQGWVGFGIGKKLNEMIGSEAVIGWAGPTPSVHSYLLGAKRVSGMQNIDSSIPLTETSACGFEDSKSRSWTVVKFTRSIVAGSNSIGILAGDFTPVVLAFGSQRKLSSHEEKSPEKIDFVRGTAGKVPVNAGKLAHGILMFISWGVLLQFGAVFARYAKSLKGAIWFKVHRIIQFVGFLISIAGFILIIIVTDGRHFHNKNGHGQIGLTVMILGVVQVIVAMFRPNPANVGQSKSILRVIWEFKHWWIGRLALVLAVANIFLGLDKIHAPVGWTITYGIFVAASVLALAGFELYRKFGIDRPETAYEYVKLATAPDTLN